MTSKDAHWHQFVAQLHRLDNQWTHFLEQRLQLEEQHPQLDAHWRQFVQQRDQFEAQQKQVAEMNNRLDAQQTLLDQRRQAFAEASARNRTSAETPFELRALGAVFVTLLQLASS